MTTITAKVPAPLAAKLTAEARARRIGKSAIVRELLERHFKTRGKQRRPTFRDLAGHLTGSIKGGPTDLAANPKYLEGFGE